MVTFVTIFKNFQVYVATKQLHYTIFHGMDIFFILLVYVLPSEVKIPSFQGFSTAMLLLLRPLHMPNAFLLIYFLKVNYYRTPY